MPPDEPDPFQREQELIDLLIDACPPPEGARVGPGDDAAVWGEREAITVDTMVEGVHWDARLRAADVGYKLVAVSVSDLGAMGARPAWMVLSVSVPSPVDAAWMEGFAEGLGQAARRWGVALIGGDTTRSPIRVLSITMGGVLESAPVLRTGARPGDDLWITGWPGLAGAGYLLADPPPAALAALRRPSPPSEFARAAARLGLPSAMMDTSDGLASDLPRLCRAAGVGATVDPHALPLHPSLEGQDRVALQVGGGDDFQLLLTAPPERAEALRALAAEHSVALSRVGRITPAGPVTLSGAAWPSGYSHFEASR